MIFFRQLPTDPFRFRGPLLGALLGLTLVLCSCDARTDVKVLRLGHGLDVQHPVHRSMMFMAERLEELSGGKLTIRIYPSGQLGSERECLELAQIGSLAITKVSAAVLEGFAPSYKVLSLPYIYKDEGHRFRIWEGPIGKEILKDGERFWLRGLCYYDAGSRSFYTTKHPIDTPQDLAGLKIRVQESATAVALINALGGAATPVAWGELYTALQQGVVDGAENNPPSFQQARHYEVAKYYSLNEHTGVPDVLIIGTKTWDKLSSQEQQWLQQAADESAEHHKQLWREGTEAALKELEANGVIISRPDRKPFADKVQPMLDGYKDDPNVGPLLERIRNTQ